jgi:capsular polysaccharide transport system permease protein
MDKERPVAAREQWGSETQRSLPVLIAGAITRTSTAVARQVLRAAALRGPWQDEKEAAIPPKKPLRLPNGYLLTFVVLVAIPSFLSDIYLAFLASDQYVAEARFAVKSPQSDFGSSSTDTKSMSSSSSGGISLPTIANQDAYIVSNYIGSRAAIEDVARNIGIRAVFQRPEADFWARLKNNASAEELTDYWKKMVSTYVDTMSGIVVLTVRAFRPGDARALAAAILEASEKLANDVSARARKSLMQEAEDELRRSEQLVRAALLDLRNFRDRQGFIDPGTAATSTGELLMQAMSDKIRLQNDYYVSAKATSPNAPTVVGLKTRLDALDNQIEQLRAKLTGNSPEGRTIAAALVTFEELEFKRIFAEKLYTMAQDALEQARLKAEQQNIFVETFVPPALPEEAKYPERLALSFLIPLGLLILWGIFALTAAAVNDHRY